MVAVLVAALLSQVSPVHAKDVMAPRRPICSNFIRIGGPAAVEMTVGTIRVYSFRGDFNLEVRRVRANVSMQAGLDEFTGFSGMLWFWNSTDHSFIWNAGNNIPAIGLIRDFKASRQRLPHPYAPHIEGQRAKGWITVLAFDGTIEYKPEFSRPSTH